jgi:hypothetical protein
MRLSIANLLKPALQRSQVARGLVLFDHLLGVGEIDRLYQGHGFSGLKADAFTRKFLDLFDISLLVDGSLETIPRKGPVIVCAKATPSVALKGWPWRTCYAAIAVM